MFTGIIEELGKVSALIKGDKIMKQLQKHHLIILEVAVLLI